MTARCSRFASAFSPRRRCAIKKVAPPKRLLPVNDPVSPELPPQRIAELIQTIKESADKLASDHTSRGDLKIISRTLRELRMRSRCFRPTGTTAR